MTIRQSNYEDIPYIMEIIDQGKSYLKSMGLDQWQNGYPNVDSFVEDINANSSYVVCHEDRIIATFMAANTEEVTYNQIYDGNWLTSLDNKKYMVIHRIAVHHDYKGKRINSKIIEYVTSLGESLGCNSIRIDTHPDNLSMQKALCFTEFHQCGIILLKDGAKRIAYEILI